MNGGDMRCPACRELAWFHNGVTLVESDDGTLHVQQVEAERDGQDLWSCMACGYEVPTWSALHTLLRATAVRTWGATPSKPEPSRSSGS